MEARRFLQWPLLFVAAVCVSVTADAARSEKQVQDDLDLVTAKLDAIDAAEIPRFEGSPRDFDPKVFKQQAMLPLLKQRVVLLAELADVSPRQKPWILFSTDVSLAKMAFFGDKESNETLARNSTGSDQDAARMAKLAMEMRDWWKDANEAPQTKILQSLTSDAKEHATDDWLARILVILANDGAASDILAITARTTVARDMKGPWARVYAATPNKVNWPLTISGRLVDGTHFTTASWKGKVILIDFWATWCPPCREALPHVIQLYNEHHKEGLEIVGISNDMTKSDLTTFLGEHPDMKWPQLFGSSSSPQHWHELSEKFRVGGIPAYFVIDRDGVLREMEVARDVDSTIAKLLKEPANATRAAAYEAMGATAAATPAAEPQRQRPAVAADPSPTPPPAKIEPPANPVPKFDDSAAKAASALNLAKSYIVAERYESARTKLQAIISSYPNTPAAAEVKTLLTQIEGK